MYQISKKGNVYKDGLPIPLDDSTIEWQEFTAWKDGGGQPELIELTQEELEEEIQLKAEAIEAEYTARIDRLVRKHVQKLSLRSIPVPQEVVEEYDRLRAECNSKITELGSALEYR